MQKKVLLSFSIGKYHDKVLCDVVPMYASHILLVGLGNLIREPTVMVSRIVSVS